VSRIGCPLTLRRISHERATRILSVAEESATRPVEVFIDACIVAQIGRLESTQCWFCKGRGHQWNHPCRLSPKDQSRAHVKCPRLIKHTCLKCMLRGDHFYGECTAPFWGTTRKGWFRFCQFMRRKFSLRAIVLRRTRTATPPSYESAPAPTVRSNDPPAHSARPLPSIPEVPIKTGEVPVPMVVRTSAPAIGTPEYPYPSLSEISDHMARVSDPEGPFASLYQTQIQNREKDHCD
jgi:hypothetical protein